MTKIKIIKNIIFLAVAAAAAFYEFGQPQNISTPLDSISVTNSDNSLQSAYKNKKSDIQVQGSGVVTRVLPDDLKGSKHQKFILRLNSGQTLVVAHNIDLAPKIKKIKTGDKVDFYGEYEWNSRGGVLHWTHRDPKGYHVGGWLKHSGKTYQ